MPAPHASAASPQVIVLIGWLLAIVAVSGWFASETSASLPAYLLVGGLAPLLLWPLAALASLAGGPASAFGHHLRRLWPAHAGIVAVATVNGFWWVSATGVGLDRNYPQLVLSWVAALQVSGLAIMALALWRGTRTRPAAPQTLLAGLATLAAWGALGPLLALLRAGLQ